VSAEVAASVRIIYGGNLACILPPLYCIICSLLVVACQKNKVSFWSNGRYSLTTGSVNGGNCKELAGQADVDGFLVGGASLKVILFTHCFYCDWFKLLCI